jgi:hypothetical protein
MTIARQEGCRAQQGESTSPHELVEVLVRVHSHCPLPAHTVHTQ